MLRGVNSSWAERIERATALAEHDDAGRQLLLTFRSLLSLQRDTFDALAQSASTLSGSLVRDAPVVRECAVRVVETMASDGPPLVAHEAAQILAGGDTAIDDLLWSDWLATSNPRFLSKMILQPYAELLTVLAIPPVDRDRPPADSNRCPFCGGTPQLSILHSRGDLDGGGRQLLCATCATTWSFRRILCAFCGQEDEHRLAYYASPQFDHLRVDACDTCRRYLKTVDLTRLGHAVPVVDEVAGAPLDLWAREQGYEKIELNLVGL